VTNTNDRWLDIFLIVLKAIIWGLCILAMLAFLGVWA